VILPSRHQKEASVLECIDFGAFAQMLFDSEHQAEKGAQILQGILKARSPRLTDIAQQMPGSSTANYKAIQRFLSQVDPREALWRLFQVEAPFVIADPTEIPRPQARKTPYVGTLQDGKTKGFWLLALATPFRGRAIPFGFVTYSSRTIAQEESSRNLYHNQAFAMLKTLIGERPLVLDREFSYLGLLLNLRAENIHFVIRLKLGSHPPVFLDEEGQRVDLSLAPGEERVIRNIFYKGQVRVHLIGRWHKGFAQPLWVMTDLDPQQGWAIYQARMKIDECFRDLKSLLGLDKIMNKQQVNMEKMTALLMLAYAIGLLIGETIRDALYGPEPPCPENAAVAQGKTHTRRRSKRDLYSGLFILLRQKLRLSVNAIQRIIRHTLVRFSGSLA
jgi:hypothetical protein